MSFDHEKRCAARLLDAMENGRLPADQTRPLLTHTDPALVYRSVAWIRVRYHPGHALFGLNQAGLPRVVVDVRNRAMPRAVRGHGVLRIPWE